MYIINYPHLMTKNIILTGWKGSGISDALIKGLAGFSVGSIDPFYNIGLFDQGEVHFNIYISCKFCI